MKKSFYNPNRSADWNYGGRNWKLSRSKIDLFIECPRCFYLDNSMGTKRPPFPPFNLNIAVDELLKREFDGYRSEKTPHPLMTKYNIAAVPFAHEKLDTWRDNFTGITTVHAGTGLTISGALDDIWMHTDGSLVVVDYKATAKDESITELSNSPWRDQYARQLSVYRWLLEQNGFRVDSTGYLVYANAFKTEAGFADALVFETNLVTVETTTDWIDKTLHAIYDTLESKAIPPVGEFCDFCTYREACGRKLYARHKQNQATE